MGAHLVTECAACGHLDQPTLTVALDHAPAAGCGARVGVRHLARIVADDDSAAAIGRVLPRVCRAVCKVTGATDYNILQNNGVRAHQAVEHVHFHVIPKTAEAGLGITWPAGPLDGEAGADMGRQIARLL